MGLFARFRRNRAIFRYLEVCADALVARYGEEERYSPARIVTTLQALKLRARYQSLRAEVAEKHNGGSCGFLPGAAQHDSYSPNREPTGISSVDGASGFRWYR